MTCTIYGPEYNEGIIYGQREAMTFEQLGSNWSSRKVALPELPAPARAGDRNIRIIRYADVLLMHAEAACHLNKDDEARTSLNLVRERARNSSYCKGYGEGKNDYSVGPITTAGLLPAVTASGDALREAVKQERRVELAMEGLRFFDLTRWGVLLDTMEKDKETERQAGGLYEDFYPSYVQPHFYGIRSNLERHCIEGANGNKVYVFPIPLSEVQGYGLEQNPGY